MGVAFVSKPTKLTCVASLQGTNNILKTLVVDTKSLRLIGIYAKPRTPLTDWLVLLKTPDSKYAATRPTMVCGAFNAQYRT